MTTRMMMMMMNDNDYPSTMADLGALGRAWGWLDGGLRLDDRRIATRGHRRRDVILLVVIEHPEDVTRRSSSRGVVYQRLTTHA
jgi:hypothetical protein